MGSDSSPVEGASSFEDWARANLSPELEKGDDLYDLCASAFQVGAATGWVAGIVDGEGYIGLTRRTRGPGWVHDQLWLKIAATDLRMIQKLRDLVGGRIGAPRMAKKSTRPYWTWYVTKTGCHEILPKLIPFLVVKREEAEVALEFTATPKRNVDGKFQRVSPEESARRDDIKRRLTLLKRGQEEAI